MDLSRILDSPRHESGIYDSTCLQVLREMSDLCFLPAPPLRRKRCEDCSKIYVDYIKRS